MLYFSIFLLVLVLAADGILGLMVWLQGSKKKINIYFALLTSALVAWSATGFYDQATTDLHGLSIMAAVPFIAALFIVYFITLFSLHFPETHPNSHRTQSLVAWLLNLTSLPLIALLVFGGKMMIAQVTTSASIGNNIVPGPLYGVFPLFCIVWLSFALGNLFHKFRRSHDRLERIQLNYIFIGFLSMTAVALITNVAMPTLLGNPTLSRFGFLSTLFIVGFFGYTIVAHRLFNIRLLVARSVAYTLLLVTVSTLYGLSIFAIGNFFFPGRPLNAGENGLFISLAIILAFTLQPLRRFFEKITDGIFFRDRYDSQTVLNNVGSILASELILDTLLSKSLKEICSSLHISSGEFIILEENKIYKRSMYGPPPKRRLDVGSMQKMRPRTLVADELKPGERRDILQKYEIRVSLELWANEEVVGHLLLRDKLSGDVYSTQDIKLLEILRKEMAIAIVNAKAYEEISNFNATLQERIQKATEHLSSANKKLKVLDKAKDDFISMASHQLGTPLTAVTGYLSMALDEDRNNMSKAQREYVTIALESSDRLVNMAGDLLNVSRLNAGRFNIMSQTVDLVPLIQQELVQLRPSAERKNLLLTFTPPSSPIPPVSIDESKTRQVIMNFIDNAIYYTEKGSIHVSLERSGDQAVFKVTDTGIGVPSSEQGKLFAKFYRAENAKTARPDGTGLGLYLAKRVIEEQGGEIIFETTLGVGSIFGFKLPFIAKPAEAAQT